MHVTLAYKNWRVFTHTTLHLGPHNILANNLSRLHCLVTPAQIAKGKKLVEPAEISHEDEDKVYFLDQEYSGLYDEDVWECIECYLNLPDNPHPDENPLNYAHICELQQQDDQPLALQVKYKLPSGSESLSLNIEQIFVRPFVCPSVPMRSLWGVCNT